MSIKKTKYICELCVVKEINEVETYCMPCSSIIQNMYEKAYNEIKVGYDEIVDKQYRILRWLKSVRACDDQQLTNAIGSIGTDLLDEIIKDSE